MKAIWFRRRPVSTSSQLPDAGKSQRTGETPLRQWVWTAGGGHVDGLPFGMAAHPDGPPPPQPWFGGPTPAPTRIPHPADRQQAGADL